MSRFFVGQGVRLVRPYRAKYLGIEGVIAEIGPFRAGDPWRSFRSIEADTDCLVQWADDIGCQNFDQLEPILDPGLRACDEEFKRDLDKLLEGLPA